MAAIAGDFNFVGARILAELAAIFLSLGGNAYTGEMSALVGLFVWHFSFPFGFRLRASLLSNRFG